MDRIELLRAVSGHSIPGAESIDTAEVILPAVPGDRGVVVGWNHDALSGLARLLIDTDEGLATVLGDWRVIRELADALEGLTVEVVERLSSQWGMHGVLPR